ncbi:MAG: M48 family metallopeptidase [Armatimonadetes bacterium]|nr:M48 family metallopeptidase [Armatimonadota bacterium]
MKRWFAMVCLLAVSACVRAGDLTAEEVFRDGKLSDEETVALARQAADRNLKKCGNPVQDEGRTRRLNAVRERLMAALPPASAKPWAWRFSIVKDTRIGASSCGDGTVMANSGLFDLNPDDDILAAVLAHEMIHVTRRHWGERLSARYIRKTTAPPGEQAMSSVSFRVLPPGERMAQARQQEWEVDNEGLRLMTKAGFNPIGMLDYFRIIAARYDDRSAPATRRSHPLTSERIANVQKLLAELWGEG